MDGPTSRSREEILEDHIYNAQFELRCILNALEEMSGQLRSFSVFCQAQDEINAEAGIPKRPLTSLEGSLFSMYHFACERSSGVKEQVQKLYDYLAPIKIQRPLGGTGDY